MAVDLMGVASEAFCYLTTRGRASGDAHEIEIWFAARGSTVYMLSGGGDRADWVRNIRATPDVEIRVGALHLAGHGRVVEDPDEEAWARAALLEKYNPNYSGDLNGWSQTALPIGVDILQ